VHRLLAGVRAGKRWIGDLSRVFLRGVGLEPNGTIPHLLFMCYQATFCIITAALISGAIVERMRFSGLRRLHHAVGARRLRPDRPLGLGRRLAVEDGRADFAGGTVVHVNAGVAALSRASWSAKRRDYQSMRCCRTTCRSRCSAPACSGSAGSVSTPAAPSRPTVSPRWRSRRRCWRRPGRWSCGRCSTRSGRAARPRVGAATAIVVGLVAVTPAAGFVGPISAIVLGAVAGASQLCGPPHPRAHVARRFTRRGRRTRSGGTVGALLTGVFAQKALNGVPTARCLETPRSC
jgi:Amt family ammonium transporter